MLNIRPRSSTNHVQNSDSAAMFILLYYETIFTWTELTFYTSFLEVNDTFKFNNKMFLAVNTDSGV